MALDDITKTIIDEAKEQAKKIKSEGQKELETLRKSFQKKTEQELSRIAKDRKRLIKQIEDQARLTSAIKAKNAILEEKQNIIDRVFSQAQEELARLGGEDKKELLRKLIRLLPEGKSGTIKASSQDKRVINEIIQEMNLTHLEVSEDTLDDGGGGFMYLSQDVEMNCTLSELIAEQKQKLMQEVAKILF